MTLPLPQLHSLLEDLRSDLGSAKKTAMIARPVEVSQQKLLVDRLVAETRTLMATRMDRDFPDDEEFYPEIRLLMRRLNQVLRGQITGTAVHDVLRSVAMTMGRLPR